MLCLVLPKEKTSAASAIESEKLGRPCRAAHAEHAMVACDIRVKGTWELRSCDDSRVN